MASRAAATVTKGPAINVAEGKSPRARACVTVNAAVLSGTCRGVPSSGCTLKSGGFTAYAQEGGQKQPLLRAPDTPSPKLAK
jgi:hypothetical protein